MRNLNKTKYLLRSRNSVKRKATPGQPNPGTLLSENKASYKTLELTYPYAVVIPLTLIRSLSWTLHNQISYLKGFFMDSFTLGPTPKINFTRTIEHTSATAWVLADLRFSLNTLSKLREFNTEFCTIDKPRALYLYAYRKPKTTEIRTLAIERPDRSLATSGQSFAISFQKQCNSILTGIF
jgi:hypothetical protein